jgi:hypothetical protein
MTDFLSSLIARNLESVEVIQPRLASRFEPASPMSGSVPNGSVGDAPEEAAQQSGKSDHVLKTSPWQASEPPPESRRPGEDLQEKPPTRRPAQVPGEKYPEVVPQPPVAAQAENLAVQTRSSLEQTAEKAFQAEDSRPVGGEKLSVSPPVRPEATPAAPGKTAPPGPPENGPAPPRFSAEPPIQTVLVEPASPARGRSGTDPPILPASPGARPEEIVSPAPLIPAVPAASLINAEAARMPPEPPVIRINIGRVEVRAVIAPPAPPPPRPPARSGPSLSLEDYLKGRDEGKR